MRRVYGVRIASDRPVIGVRDLDHAVDLTTPNHPHAIEVRLITDWRNLNALDTTPALRERVLETFAHRIARMSRDDIRAVAVALGIDPDGTPDGTPLPADDDSPRASGPTGRTGQ